MSTSGGDDHAGGSRRRGPRKLRRKTPGLSSSTPDLPEPLLDSDDSADDGHAEVIPTPMSVNMNQSIFGLIAAAGSRVDFNTRFDGNSSDEEDGSKESSSSPPSTSQTTVLRPDTKKHKKSLSKHRLLKSIATLPRLKPKSKHESSRLSQPEPSADKPSQSGDANETQTSSSPGAEASPARRPSVMSRMLQARAEMSSRPSFDMERRSADLRRSEDENDETTPLARRLMEIFGFSEPEQVIQGECLYLMHRQLANTRQNTPAGYCKVSFCRVSCTSPQDIFAFMLIYLRKRYAGVLRHHCCASY